MLGSQMILHHSTRVSYLWKWWELKIKQRRTTVYSAVERLMKNHPNNQENVLLQVTVLVLLSYTSYSLTLSLKI